MLNVELLWSAEVEVSPYMLLTMQRDDGRATWTGRISIPTSIASHHHQYISVPMPICHTGFWSSNLIFFLLEKIFTPHFKCNQSWGTATWKTLAKDWTLNYSWTHWQWSVLHGSQEPQFQGAWTPAHLDIIIWIKASRKLLTHSPIAHTAIQQDSFN